MDNEDLSVYVSAHTDNGGNTLVLDNAYLGSTDYGVKEGNLSETQRQILGLDFPSEVEINDDNFNVEIELARKTFITSVQSVMEPVQTMGRMYKNLTKGLDKQTIVAQ